MTLPMDFSQVAFQHPFRRYQQGALDAFERARAGSRKTLYVVLPPGAGKTVLGLEIARRLGQKTLVLTPNTAVQGQWVRQWGDFQPAGIGASTDPATAAPILVLTYQTISSFDAHQDGLDERARALARDASGASAPAAPEDTAAVGQAAGGVAGAIAERELSHARHTLRIRAARNEDHAELLKLLHPNALQLIERVKATGPWTLILDECHHLLETWGAVARALVRELGDAVHVVGLTATPPGTMSEREFALYSDLFGGVDYEAVTPAVVKEGDLAPYQELVYLTTPTERELEYVAGQHEHFRRLLDRILAPDFTSTPLVEWLRRRVVERKAADGAQVSWGRFERDEPDLATAALRFFVQHQLDLPDGVRATESHRLPMTADDWIVLIDDFCTRYLRSQTGPADAAAWEEIRTTLPALGYVLTRQGIRSYVSPVDRVLALSASKAAAALTILATETEILGANLRALVLCDYEHVSATSLDQLAGVLDSQAGSARLILQILAADRAIAALNPILVTGQTVSCTRATAKHLVGWLESAEPDLKGNLAFETPGVAGGAPSWDDVVVVQGNTARWQPSVSVPLLTRYFEAGESRCLVGTRGLLGEGWDAKRVNVLVDLTTASTATAVHQMRGRTLRLDPALPEKVADNWDVVCVAPALEKGTADYGRFVRKHHAYFALTAQGEIESGVSHVDSALSPYGPPSGEQFGAINGDSLARARGRPAARARWAIGTPYADQQAQTVRVFSRRPLGLSTRGVFSAGPGTPGANVRRRLWTALGLLVGCFLVGAIGGAPLAGLLVGVVAAVVSLGSLLRAVEAKVAQRSPSSALEDLAGALSDALRDVGAVGKDVSAASIRLVPQADGYVRCFLVGASAEDNQLFSTSLDELLAPIRSPRYIIPRFIVDRPASWLEVARLVLAQLSSRRPGARVVYHAVPTHFAANKQRVEVFQRAWNRYVSPGAALFYQDPRAQAVIDVQHGANPFDVLTQMRTLWY